MPAFKKLYQDLNEKNAYKRLQYAFFRGICMHSTRTCRDGTKIRRSLKGRLIWQVSKWSTARANKSFRADAFKLMRRSAD